MKTIFNILDKRRPIFIWWLGVLAVAVVCYVTVLTDRSVDMAPLLVIPVTLVSWYGSSKAGAALAIVAISSLFLVRDLLIESEVSRLSLIYDSLITFSVYLFMAIIVTNFREVHEVEVVAADTDELTGAHSTRSFYAGLANEILRSSRYKHRFSLAYIDVDDFKKINDTLGHSVGDKLLMEIPKCLAASMRATDIVARLGGDEFACLMPETDQHEAKAAIFKAEKLLMGTMKDNDWDVSFSIGVVTFDSLPDDVHEAVKIADELMYTVKNNVKNDVAYQVWKTTPKKRDPVDDSV